MTNSAIRNTQDGTESDVLKAWHEGTVDFVTTLTTDPHVALQFCQSLVRTLATNTALAPSDGRQPLADALRVAWDSVHSEPDLSIVVPVYNEEENLPTLHSRLTSVLAGIGSAYEIVFVDDGSCDKSAVILQQLMAQDSRIVVVELARNFGHQAAISAGLDYSRGKAVIVMDADLQDPPDVLPRFIAKWREGYDVVYAIRERRKEGWLKRATYAAFYRLVRRVASIEIPLDAGDFCIMDRRVVDLLVSMPERNRFVRGIRSWVGLKQTGLPYERQARYAGHTKYTFSRLVYLALDGLVSFSYVPLRLITMLGFGVSLVSIVLAIFYLIKKLTSDLNPPGFATTVVAIFFLAGIQLITIGVIGEYVGRIFEEVKRRPLYITRRVMRRES